MAEDYRRTLIGKNTHTRLRHDSESRTAIEAGKVKTQKTNRVLGFLHAGIESCPTIPPAAKNTIHIEMDQGGLIF